MAFDKDAHTQHISQQFNEELEQVRTHLLEMGGMVERQVNEAIRSLIDADSGKVEVSILGENNIWGMHMQGTVRIALPEA